MTVLQIIVCAIPVYMQFKMHAHLVQHTNVCCKAVLCTIQSDLYAQQCDAVVNFPFIAHASY